MTLHYLKSTLFAEKIVLSRFLTGMLGVGIGLFLGSYFGLV